MYEYRNKTYSESNELNKYKSVLYVLSFFFFLRQRYFRHKFQLIFALNRPTPDDDYVTH